MGWFFILILLGSYYGSIKACVSKRLGACTDKCHGVCNVCCGYISTQPLDLLLRLPLRLLAAFINLDYLLNNKAGCQVEVIIGLELSGGNKVEHEEQADVIIRWMWEG